MSIFSMAKSFADFLKMLQLYCYSLMNVLIVFGASYKDQNMTLGTEII